jgi:hypothetical protein
VVVAFIIAEIRGDVHKNLPTAVVLAGKRTGRGE